MNLMIQIETSERLRESFDSDQKSGSEVGLGYTAPTGNKNTI